jgi:hypothetical protein
LTSIIILARFPGELHQWSGGTPAPAWEVAKPAAIKTPAMQMMVRGNFMAISFSETLEYETLASQIRRNTRLSHIAALVWWILW